MRDNTNGKKFISDFNGNGPVYSEVLSRGSECFYKFLSRGEFVCIGMWPFEVKTNN
jgi:hypothetical protein